MYRTLSTMLPECKTLPTAVAPPRPCHGPGWQHDGVPDPAIPAPELLRALHARSRHLGIAPPAAFLGHWRDEHAVIVPSVALAPTRPENVFDCGVDDVVVVGFRSFPDIVPGAPGPLPEAVRGTAPGFFTLDAEGTWRTHADAPDPYEVVQRYGAADVGHTATGPAVTWSAPDRSAHRRAVDACLAAIRDGEVYQTCLSTRLDGRLHTETLAAFLSVAHRAPAARAAYLEGDWGAVLAFSPEEFLIRDGDLVRTSPIKGTIPAAGDPAALLASAKDIAENIMIVDLARNDLGRVATTGSVSVTELLAVRPAPGVHHLVSTVTARTDVPNDQLLGATFPPASVTGTPKDRARELIPGWEQRSRGLHCGTYGLATPDRLDLAVAIRTLEVTPDGRCEFGVGGGITIDSDPHAEWDECVHKAAFTWGGGPAPW